ncbi:hypothetical protein ME763_37905 (plasmid) [Streptomyces murinus]|uniref:hypothetical protein n=1 Tax=Streptomyces murinus TaxID=33900 RepID=UPI00237A06F5|nr:hypothetical protein [Streptomyces murinus]WDO11285.1 hypothetical protein ME763_37905 [Streptomyces murinus]
MPARPRRRPARRQAARSGTAAATVLLLAPTGRTALACASVALLLLLVLGAAYAPSPAHRIAARHTLHLLLRLAPWYPDRPQATGERRR